MSSIKWHRSDSIGSTNTYLRELGGGDPAYDYEVAVADFQTAGRGQTGNRWESEEGKNLLCSILLPPNKNLYFLNIAVGVALVRVIGEDFTIKWPNDIYYRDKKIAGILIENAIIGNEIKYSIAGIGLNVNQTTFVSDAPNPVSLKQIRGQEFDIKRLMSHLFETVQSVLRRISIEGKVSGRSKIKTARLRHASLMSSRPARSSCKTKKAKNAYTTSSK